MVWCLLTANQYQLTFDFISVGNFPAGISVSISGWLGEHAANCYRIRPRLGIIVCVTLEDSSIVRLGVILFAQREGLSLVAQQNVTEEFIIIYALL